MVEEELLEVLSWGCVTVKVGDINDGISATFKESTDGYITTLLRGGDFVVVIRGY
jgi:hypothetical protein